MSIVFPTSPTAGATYTDPATGRTWVWDGTKWNPGAGGGAYLPISGGNLTGALGATTVNASGQIVAPIINASSMITGPDPPAGDSSQLLATTAWINANRPQNRNRIINGAMQLDQRNNGAIGTASGYSLDRWKVATSVVGQIQWARVSGTAPGFPYCLSVKSVSAYTAAAGDVFQIFQPIEADMVGDFGWGTANAQSVTLSFWAQSSIAGNFSGAISSWTSARTYLFSYSLPTNTWTKVVVTIPGDTSGVWTLSGNSGVVALDFDLGSGSNYRGAAGAWLNSTLIGVTGAQSIVATNGAVFNITGVQLEVGTQATPWDWRPIGEELALCQRYYQVYNGIVFGGYGGIGGQGMWMPIIYPEMRSAPSAVASGVSFSNMYNFAAYSVTPNSLYFNALFAAAGSGTVAFAFTLNAEL